MENTTARCAVFEGVGAENPQRTIYGGAATEHDMRYGNDNRPLANVFASDDADLLALPPLAHHIPFCHASHNDHLSSNVPKEERKIERTLEVVVGREAAGGRGAEGLGTGMLSSLHAPPLLLLPRHNGRGNGLGAAYSLALSNEHPTASPNNNNINHNSTRIGASHHFDGGESNNNNPSLSVASTTFPPNTAPMAMASRYVFDEFADSDDDNDRNSVNNKDPRRPFIVAYNAHLKAFENMFFPPQSGGGGGTLTANQQQQKALFMDTFSRQFHSEFMKHYEKIQGIQKMKLEREGIIEKGEKTEPTKLDKEGRQSNDDLFFLKLKTTTRTAMVGRSSSSSAGVGVDGEVSTSVHALSESRPRCTSCVADVGSVSRAGEGSQANNTIDSVLLASSSLSAAVTPATTAAVAVPHPLFLLGLESNKNNDTCNNNNNNTAATISSIFASVSLCPHQSLGSYMCAGGADGGLGSVGSPATTTPAAACCSTALSVALDEDGIDIDENTQREKALERLLSAEADEPLRKDKNDEDGGGDEKREEDHTEKDDLSFMYKSPLVMRHNHLFGGHNGGEDSASAATADDDATFDLALAIAAASENPSERLSLRRKWQLLQKLRRMKMQRQAAVERLAVSAAVAAVNSSTFSHQQQQQQQQQHQGQYAHCFHSQPQHPSLPPPSPFWTRDDAGAASHHQLRCAPAFTTSSAAALSGGDGDWGERGNNALGMNSGGGTYGSQHQHQHQHHMNNNKKKGNNSNGNAPPPTMMMTAPPHPPPLNVHHRPRHHAPTVHYMGAGGASHHHNQHNHHQYSHHHHPLPQYQQLPSAPSPVTLTPPHLPVPPFGGSGGFGSNEEIMWNPRANPMAMMRPPPPAPPTAQMQMSAGSGGDNAPPYSASHAGGGGGGQQQAAADAWKLAIAAQYQQQQREGPGSQQAHHPSSASSASHYENQRQQWYNYFLSLVMSQQQQQQPSPQYSSTTHGPLPHHHSAAPPHHYHLPHTQHQQQEQQQQQQQQQQPYIPPRNPHQHSSRAPPHSHSHSHQHQQSSYLSPSNGNTSGVYPQQLQQQQQNSFPGSSGGNGIVGDPNNVYRRQQ